MDSSTAPFGPEPVAMESAHYCKLKVVGLSHVTNKKKNYTNLSPVFNSLHENQKIDNKKFYKDPINTLRPKKMPFSSYSEYLA